MISDRRAGTEATSSDSGFYDRTFAASPAELDHPVREAAFGEDIAQFSWTTAEEHRRFHGRLGIDAGVVAANRSAAREGLAERATFPATKAAAT